MSLSAISGNIATAQVAAEAYTKSQPAPQQVSSPNAAPDTVTISAAAQHAMASAGDVDHDGDSH